MNCSDRPILCRERLASGGDSSPQQIQLGHDFLMFFCHVGEDIFFRGVHFLYSKVIASLFSFSSEVKLTLGDLLDLDGQACAFFTLLPAWFSLGLCIRLSHISF